MSDIVIFIASTEPIALGFGFYLGFISWCVFIWINILIAKYDKERIKSLIAVSKPEIRYVEKIKYVEKTKNKSEEKDEEDESGLIGFFSYSMRDSQLFNIKKIAKSLNAYRKIDEILYCEESTRDNFIKYMDENIGKCDIMILFCSPNALKSGFVNDEWMAAHAMKKPIIPVFLDEEHIPPLLRARIGVKFDVFNFKKNIKEIYDVIKKKLQS
jgi:hypothetical protein